MTEARMASIVEAADAAESIVPTGADGADPMAGPDGAGGHVEEISGRRFSFCSAMAPATGMD